MATTLPMKDDVPDVRLQPGDVAPDFTLYDVDRTPVSLPAYRGRTVVLAFLPEGDDEDRRHLDGLGALVDADPGNPVGMLGVRPCEARALAEWQRDQALPLPVLCDEKYVVHQAFGAYCEGGGSDRTRGAHRTTVVLDGRGQVQHAWYGGDVDEHLDLTRQHLTP